MNRSKVGEQVKGTIASGSVMSGIVAGRFAAKQEAIKAREQAVALEQYRAEKDIRELSRDAGVGKDAVKAYAEGAESQGAFTEEALKAAVYKFGAAGAKEVYQDFRQERGEGMMKAAVDARTGIRQSASDVGLDSKKFMSDADRFARTGLTGDQAIQEAFKVAQPMSFGERLTREHMAERAPGMEPVLKPTGNKRGLGKAYFTDITEAPFDASDLFENDDEGGLL